MNADLHNWYKPVCICKVCVWEWPNLALFVFEGFFETFHLAEENDALHSVHSSSARGADQIKREIRVHRLCLEEIKTWYWFLLNTEQYLLLFVYVTGVRGESFYHSMAQCFLIWCSSFGAHWHSLADFTLYLKKFSWNFGGREKYILPCCQSHSKDTPLQSAPHD